MFKRLCILFLVLGMVSVLSACGSAEQSDTKQPAESEKSEVVAGGWELAGNEAAALPEEVQAAFDKAREKFTGSDLKPVAYVASQVVAGTNHMFLCEATTTTAEPKTSYQMVVVYEDLQGNAEITATKDFDMAAYTEGGSTDIASEKLSGGWSVPDAACGSAVPDDAKAAFDKATSELGGSDLEPLALLGTQVVSGTNYAFLCKSTLVTQEPVSGIQVVTVYADLDGKAEVSNISTVDPADYNG